MNEVVANFIAEKKKKQAEKSKKQKEKHLLDIGLLDYTGVEKQYRHENDDPAYDYPHLDEKGYFRYIGGEPKVLDISDEDYEEICKVCPPQVTIEENFEDKLLVKVDSIRKMLKFFTILTIISLIISVIVIIYGVK